MIIGARLAERIKAMSLSQAELARRVGISQQAVGKLINGRSRATTHIARFARELRTTPAYLEGETDDPDVNAPAPQPTVRYQVVTMQVLLPAEPALARMFEGLLRTIDRSASLGEQALLLAKRLPTGLRQLQDLLPDQPMPTIGASRSAAPAMPDPSPRR